VRIGPASFDRGRCCRAPSKALIRVELEECLCTHTFISFFDVYNVSCARKLEADMFLKALSASIEAAVQSTDIARGGRVTLI